MSKKSSIHPGEILLTEFMKPLGLSAYRVAKEIKLVCDNSEIPEPRDESMNRDDEIVRHEFAPGEEPTIYTRGYLRLDSLSIYKRFLFRGVERGVARHRS